MSNGARTENGEGGSSRSSRRGRTTKDAPSDLTARWLYAIEDGWQPFTDKDNDSLEQRYTSLVRKGRLADRSKVKTKERSGGSNDAAGEGDEATEDKEKGASNASKKNDSDKTPKQPFSGVDAVRKAFSGIVEEGGKRANQAVSSGAATPLLGGDGDGSEDGKAVVNEQLDPDAPEEERITRVEVMEDKLFDVNLETMRLFPVFWKGVLLPVVRSYWFYSASDGGYAPIPYDEALSQDLDRAYEAVKPWKGDGDGELDEEDQTPGRGKDTSKRRLSVVSSESESMDEDELYDLPSMPNEGQIHFEGPEVGRIFSKDVKGRLMSVLGGSLVTRGWDATLRRSKELKKSGFFEPPRLPWASGRSKEDGKDNDDAESCKGTSDGNSNDRQGSKRAQRGPGAAQIDKRPVKADGGVGVASGVEKKEQNQGLFTRLWPSSDASFRPDVGFLRLIGWSNADATDEGERKAQQANTEEGLRKEDDGEKEHDEDKEPISSVREDEPPELVLAVHGIGQKLVEDFDALDFVYDIERLRNQSKTLADQPGLRRISKGKRVQFIPICWRREISFDDGEPMDGNDNKYTLSDISNEASIPVVRNVISKVILDVPYYLSRHQQTMIDAVKHELNRIYRLFTRRNPDFERRGGRVSLICHSLGSSIAADILSNQPTMVPPLREQGAGFLEKSAPLCFNVKHLFFVGSPNGFFFHLRGGQLIARKGTARTRDVPDGAASDEVGRYGCLAAEAIYNCYNTTDPVAFKLAPTVDRDYAHMLRPMALSDAVPALLEALSSPRLSLSKCFEVVHPFSKAGDAAAMASGQQIDLSGNGKNAAKIPSKGEQSNSIGKEGPTLVEKGAAQKEAQAKARSQEKHENADYNVDKLIRAEQRFRALNPHGCIDFTFESGGYQYFEMLSAHVSYWTSKTFATFVLTQLLTDYTSAAAARSAPTLVPTLDVDEGDGAEEEEGGEQSAGSDDSKGSEEDARDGDTGQNAK